MASILLPAPEPVLDAKRYASAISTLPVVVPDTNPPQQAPAANPAESAPICVSPIFESVETLSDDEGMEFLACETVVETGWRGVLDVGLAFARVRDGRLYRVQFKRFEDYCQSKWQYGRDYVDRVISAALVTTRLLTACQQKPQHEAQVRTGPDHGPHGVSRKNVRPLNRRQQRERRGGPRRRPQGGLEFSANSVNSCSNRRVSGMGRRDPGTAAGKGPSTFRVFCVFRGHHRPPHCCAASPCHCVWSVVPPTLTPFILEHSLVPPFDQGSRRN